MIAQYGIIQYTLFRQYAFIAVLYFIAWPCKFEKEEK